MQNLNIIQQISISAIPMLLAITVHEGAHALCANYLGDNTARYQGRVSLNPIKHIDPIGSILFPLICFIMHSPIFFGWAKPVPINPNNLSNPKRDSMLIALAGPISNILMAIAWAIAAKIVFMIAQQGTTQFANISYNFFFIMAMQGIFINAILATLNLLPIPPLDGSKVLNGLLSNSMATKFSKLEPYGIIILIILMLTGVLSQIIQPGAFLITNGLIHLIKV